MGCPTAGSWTDMPGRVGPAESVWQSRSGRVDRFSAPGPHRLGRHTPGLVALRRLERHASAGLAPLLEEEQGVLTDTVPQAAKTFQN